MSTPPKRPFRWQRDVLPTLIFMAVVGGLAYLLMNMRRFDQRTFGEKPQKQEEGGPGLEFQATRAVWDLKDPSYARAYEKGQEGFYDFPFKNPTPVDVELGMVDSSCDCSHVKMALGEASAWEAYSDRLGKDPAAHLPLADWNWTTLKPDPVKGFAIPAGAKGILRLAWVGKKSPGEILVLKVTIWGQPKGQAQQRRFTELAAPVVMALPLQMAPPRAHIGVLTRGDRRQAEFTIWSTTRAELPLTFPLAPDDAPFQVDMKPLGQTEAAEFRAKMKKEDTFNTRIRSVYRMVVSVAESAPDAKDPKKVHELPLGPFAWRVPILLDGELLPLDMPVPVVAGSVKGEIDVSGQDEQGRINFKSFAAKLGARRSLVIWADLKTELEVAGKSPQLLEVTLTRRPKESTSTRGKWTLDVVAPPDAAAGPFPEGSGVFLMIKGPQPRQIRIPVLGNAFQG